ncbi:MAG TPA: hypothetical protein VGS57_04685 [Thermoanaerobaculia bacterium]|nr:hypothetical protein [Thermoanaerobaculia bacterium]
MLAVLALVTGVVFAAAEPTRAQGCGGAFRGRRCSTPPAGGGNKALDERMLAGAHRLGRGERIVVPIVYHVIYDSHPANPPDDLAHAPPAALMELQTAVLNRAFHGTAISFSTAGVEARSFVPWRRQAGTGYPPLEDIVDMIVDLNAERRGVLHVFLMQFDESAAPPETKMMFQGFRRRTDGIMMGWDLLPYDPILHPLDPQSLLYWSEGETLVHLVGHYLGLLHTYEPWPVEVEGNVPRCSTHSPPCAQISDHVRDTPVHLGGLSDDCAPVDSCPEYPGLDPIGNYMSAEPDLCTHEFTPGQVLRMERMVRAFRPYLIVGTPASQH